MRRVVLASLALTWPLAACSGGGSSSEAVSPITPTPTPAPTVSPSPTPTPAPTGTVAYLHTFAVADGDGAQPNGPLLQASDGNFYGTTRSGGANLCRSDRIPCGTIFRMTPSGEESVLYTFGASPNDGYTPFGALIQGADGALYGLASNGGTYGGGVAFRITLSGTYTVLHSFGGPGEGLVPTGGLTLGSDGNFYGATSSGGANHCANIPQNGANCGTIFRMTPAGAVTTLYSFGSTGSDGTTPLGPVLRTADGTIYGTTSLGGATNGGTIFRLSTEGKLTTLYTFGVSRTDPVAPQGSLILGPDGAFYGTTPSGGGGNCQYGCGTVYRIDQAGKLTIVYAFGLTDSMDGRGPSAVLTLGKDGYLYGTTRSGGQNQGGTVFRLSGTGTLATLFSFGPMQKQPYDPETGVIEGKDGALYGTTFYNEGLGGVGARFGSGTAYRLTFR